MCDTRCFVCLTRIEEINENLAEHVKLESNEIKESDYGELINIFSKYWQIEFKEKDLQSLDLKGREIQLCGCCGAVASESINVVSQLESLQEILNKLLSKVVSCVIESESLHLESKNVVHQKDDKESDQTDEIEFPSIQSIRNTLIQSFDVKVKLTSCRLKRNQQIRTTKTRRKPNRVEDIKNISESELDDGLTSFSSDILGESFSALPESSNSINHLEFNSESETGNDINDGWDFEENLSEGNEVSSSDTEKESPRLTKFRKKSFAISKKIGTHRKTVRATKRESRRQNHAKQIGAGKYIYQGYEFSELEVGEGYQCGTCLVSCTGSTRNRENIMLHLKRCHINEGKFPCEVCGKAFGTGKELRRHGIVHTNLRSHMCELCGKTFKINYQLQLHMKRHDSLQTHECPICQKSVTTVYSLQNHIKRVHEGVRDFQCDKCLYKFTSSSSLKRHIRGHDRESQAKQNCNLNLVDRPFQCEHCGARLATKYSLNYHMITVHAASKNFACSVCDKKFKTRKALRRHAVCHSNEYDYMCTICGLRLKRARSLKLHMMTHEGIKRFECEICNAKFAYDQGRKIHIATVHEGQKNYECKICLKKFGTPQSLARHNVVHTGERRYICETCGNKYQQSNVLKRHIQEVHLKIKPRPRKSYKKIKPNAKYQETGSCSGPTENRNLETDENEIDSSSEDDEEVDESQEVNPSSISLQTSKSLFTELGISKLESLTPVQFDVPYMHDVMDYTSPMFCTPPGKKLD